MRLSRILKIASLWFLLSALCVFVAQAIYNWTKYPKRIDDPLAATSIALIGASILFPYLFDRFGPQVRRILLASALVTSLAILVVGHWTPFGYPAFEIFPQSRQSMLFIGVVMSVLCIALLTIRHGSIALGMALVSFIQFPWVGNLWHQLNTNKAVDFSAGINVLLLAWATTIAVLLALVVVWFRIGDVQRGASFALPMELPPWSGGVALRKWARPAVIFLVLAFAGYGAVNLLGFGGKPPEQKQSSCLPTVQDHGVWRLSIDGARATLKPREMDTQRFAPEFEFSHQALDSRIRFSDLRPNLHFTVGETDSMIVYFYFDGQRPFQDDDAIVAIINNRAQRDIELRGKSTAGLLYFGGSTSRLVDLVGAKPRPDERLQVTFFGRGRPLIEMFLNPGDLAGAYEAARSHQRRWAALVSSGDCPPRS